MAVARTKGAAPDELAVQRPSQFPDTTVLRAESRLGRTGRTLRSVWPFIVLAIMQVILAAASLQVLNALRVFSSSESQWSKGQKDAIYAISSYVLTGNEATYQRFESSMYVPLSGMRARKLIEKRDEPSRVLAMQVIQDSHHAPAEVADLLWLTHYFKNHKMVRNVLDKWRDTDAPLLELQTLGAEIKASLQIAPIVPQQRHLWLTRIGTLQDQLGNADQAFSLALSDTSNRLKTWLWWANIGGALCMLTLLIWYAGRMRRDTEQAEGALDVVSERASTTLAAIGDAVITTTATGEVLYMNLAAERLLGASLDQVFMRSLAERVRTPPGGGEETLVQDHIANALGGKSLTTDTVFTVYDSHQRARQVKMDFTPIGAHAGMTEAVFVFHDVSQEQTYMRELAWQATHDQLTGLVNRYEFERRLGQVLEQAAQPGGCSGAMMYLDLDQFKVINDTGGHPAGDAMLRAISTMLQHGLRADDTLARVGGDEFAILLESCPFDVANELAEQIRDAAQHLRIQWGERSLSSSISIGLIKLAPPIDSVEEAFRLADMASYGAKQRGRNTVYAYDPSVDEEIARFVGEMEWVERIKSALENNHFILYAQPIQALSQKAEDAAGNGLHVEIQMRMRMPDGSLVSPVQFIPSAERYGLMPLIDRWVVNKTLETLAAMQRAWVVMPISCCAINLSGTTLGDEKLLDFLRHQIEFYGVNPRILCFEITETAAITHLPNAIRLLKALKVMGCKFSMDDFGSGVSSFGSLKNLPVDFLKIDGAIVADMLREPAHRAMVEAINHLSHALGMKTIAEFAATPEIVEILRGMGVDYAQGYATGKPAPFPAPQPLAPAAPLVTLDTDASRAAALPRLAT